MSTRLRYVKHVSCALQQRSGANAVATSSALRRHLHALATREVERDVVGEAQPYRTASTSASTPAQNASASTARLAEHLNDVFEPLEFPPEVASRILTHMSHKDAVRGHNARFSFIGRRVLDSYLLLFLHSLPPDVTANYDYERTSVRVVNTYTLGEHIAPRWNLPGIMRWTPPRPIYPSLNSKDLRSVGLHKVAGTTVEAVMGGIFHQFGGSVAHRVFHTRMLPHLLLPGQSAGLPDQMHDHAQEVTRKMGGPYGPLML